MKTKQIFIFAFVLILIFFNLSNFVNSEETPSTGSKILQGYYSSTNLSLYSGVVFSETEEVLKITFLTPGDLPEFLTDFSNIMSSAESKHNTYLKIDKSSEFIYEAHFTERTGSNYVFGNNKFYVPFNSTVRFSNGRIKLDVKEGSFFESVPSFLDNSLFGNSVEIAGKNITLSEDFILVDGKTSLNSDGWLVEQGYVAYKSNFIGVRNQNEQILIANKNLPDYQGNYLRQTDKTLEIRSVEDGEANIIFAPGHEILNTDKKDKLYLSLENGDSVFIQNREEQGLIPSFEHKASEDGKTILKNNGIPFKFEKGEFYIKEITPPKTKEDFKEPYQSVAMEIFSDSQQNEKIRINSYRQFKIMDLNDNDLVSYNDYNLPVSARIEDNSLQTIGQLREKYPNIDFSVPLRENFNEENAPPYLFYLTDNFMKENYDENFPISDIDFVSWENSAATGINKLHIGDQGVDPYFNIVPRDNTALTIFNHEYEHIKDNLIASKEINAIQEKYKDSSEDMQAFFNEREKLLNEKNELNSRLSKVKKNSYEDVSGQLELVKIENRLENLEEKIRQEYLYSRSSGTLQQTYNQVVISSYENFYENENSRQRVLDFSEGLQKDVNKELKEISKKYPEISIKGDEPNSELIEIIEENAPSLSEEDVSLFVNLKTLSKLSSNISESNEIEIFEGAIRDLSFSLRANKEVLKDSGAESEVGEKYYSEFEKIFQEETGLPYLYSSRNYADKSLDVFDSKYFELSATFKEMSYEQKVQKINSPNPQVSKNARALTQIAFDSGKMDVEEYKSLMGENYCEKPNCCDRKCILYKLLCEGNC